MSRKKSDRQADALARETEDRMALFAFETRMEARSEQDKLRREQFLTQAREQLAVDRREAEIAGLTNYRTQAIAAALSSKQIAPQVAEMISTRLASREEIDAAVQHGIDMTSAIVAEIAQRQGEPAFQPPRNEASGRYVSQETQPGEQIDLENISYKDWVKVRGQFIKQTDQGIFG